MEFLMILLQQLCQVLKDNNHKIKKLQYHENLELKNIHLMNNKKLKKDSYVKVNKIFYFDKSNIEYYIFEKVSKKYINEILNLVSLLSEEDKLILVTNNLKKK